MKQEALIRELKKLAKASGKDFSVNKARGKGSHWKVYVGDRQTIIKGGELSPGYCRIVKKQLGL
jgi:restriction endonuclease S subunit